MADDQATGTTDAATGTTPNGADGSASGAAGGSAGESIEELRRRLLEEQNARAEAERKNAQLLSEKTRTEQMRREAEARGNGWTAPTPPTGPADPFAQQIAIQEALAASYPENTLEGLQARAMLLNLKTTRDNHLRALRNEQITAQLLSIPDSKRMAVVERIKTGQFSDVQSALAAVENESKSEEVSALQKKVDELERRLRNGGGSPVADVSTSTRDAGTQTSGKRRLGMSEWTRIQSAGGSEAKKLDDEYYAGKIELDPSR